MISIKTGEELKNWRKENHLTQAELAVLTGYTKDHISKIERNKTPLKNKLLVQIEELEALYHPPKKELPAIAKQWEAINYVREIFPEEFDLIEKEMIELVSVKVNVLHTRGSGAYLKFVTLVLGHIIKITNSMYENDEQYKAEIWPLFQEMNKAARVFLKEKMIHSK